MKNNNIIKSAKILGHIVDFLDNERIVVDIGYNDGVRINMKFFIFEEGKEIFDPISKKSLGKLEFVKQWVKVEHVQESLSIMVSDEYTTENPIMGGAIAVEMSYLMQRKIRVPINSKEKVDSNYRKNIGPVKLGDLVKNSIEDKPE